MTTFSMSIVMYYIHLWYNPKHDERYYLHGIRNACLYIRKSAHHSSFYIYGDRQFVVKHIPECRFSKALPNDRFSSWDLPYKKECDALESTCQLKFSEYRLRDSWILPNGYLKVLCRVWMFKVRALVRAANALISPLDTGHVALIDAAIDDRSHDKVFRILKARYETPFLHAQRYREGPSRTWFGRKECTMRPILNAKFLVVNNYTKRFGRKLERLFTAALVGLASGREPCPCFDEEMVLTRLFTDNQSVSHSIFYSSLYLM